MLENRLRNRAVSRRWPAFVLSLLLPLLLLGTLASPAAALKDPIPIAHRAIRQRIHQDRPNARNIQFSTTRVRRESGHTRLVNGAGVINGRRGLRRFTYSVNVDTGNGAVNGIHYNAR